MLAFLGIPDLITVLFIFSVFRQTVYYENAIPSLSPINLLLPLHLRNLRKWFLNYDAIEKRHTK